METTLIVLHLGADRKTRRGVRVLECLRLLFWVVSTVFMSSTLGRTLSWSGHHWSSSLLTPPGSSRSGTPQTEVSTEHLRGHHVQSLGHSFYVSVCSVPVVECSCSLSVVTLGCFESLFGSWVNYFTNGTQTKSILYFDRSLVRP